MRRKDLERRLRRAGWYLLRHGGAHDVWTDGDRTEAIPRHSEVHELLARRILRKVRQVPGRDG